MSNVIPARFRAAIDEHLVFNFARVEAWPLVLGVFGRPGDGKSFQLRAQLRERGVAPMSINAADLESDRAGMPGKMILDLYQDAGHRIDEGELTAVVVDDFDTTVGEWEHSTTTVNHQQVLAQLMHLADSPTEAAGKSIRRVPVIITGNDLSKIYPPLRRPGRMRTFPWLPTMEEKREVVTEILKDVLDASDIPRLLAQMPEAPIAFFSDLLVEVVAKRSSAEVARLAGDLRNLVSRQSQAAEQLRTGRLGEKMAPAELIDVAASMWAQRDVSAQSYVGS